MDVRGGIDQLARLWMQAVEGTISTCVHLNFHIDRLEYSVHSSHGTKAHPMILRGAYGRELARFWVDWPQLGSDDYVITVRSRLAEDVEQAVADMEDAITLVYTRNP